MCELAVRERLGGALGKEAGRGFGFEGAKIRRVKIRLRLLEVV
jgi:hypothetical protein